MASPDRSSPAELTAEVERVTAALSSELGVHDLIRPPLDITMSELDLSTSPATTVGRYEVGEGT
jgi:hypothetical protein